MKVYTIRLDVSVAADDDDHAEEIADSIIEHLQDFDEVFGVPEVLDVRRQG